MPSRCVRVWPPGRFAVGTRDAVLRVSPCSGCRLRRRTSGSTAGCEASGSHFTGEQTEGLWPWQHRGRLGPRSPVPGGAPNPLVIRKHEPVSCYGLSRVPQNSRLNVLTPGTSDCDLAWIEGHGGVSYSETTRVSPRSQGWRPRRKRRSGHRHTGKDAPQGPWDMLAMASHGGRPREERVLPTPGTRPSSVRAVSAAPADGDAARCHMPRHTPLFRSQPPPPCPSHSPTSALEVSWDSGDPQTSCIHTRDGLSPRSPCAPQPRSLADCARSRRGLGVE